MIKTIIEILDSNLNKVTEIKAPYEMNGGIVLRYSKELSEYGRCTFRVSSYDPIFTDFGDILKPHAYHIRIKRDNIYVWQGAIIENSMRTKDFIEVVAAEYVWYLNKHLIHRTSTDSNGTQNIYRIFKTGSMSDAVTAIMNETITDYASTNHILKNLVLGSVEDPNYPPNMTDTNGNKLTGPWQFSDTLQLTFDFHTVMYVLRAFGNYTYADFQIIQDPTDSSKLQFNFKKFLGSDHHYDINFVWGRHGNAIDFNVPRLGQRVVNDLIGIATDPNGIILHSEQTDQASISANGLLQGIAAYTDIKSQAVLNARIQAELPLISTPEEAATTMTIDHSAYPLGTYDIGDIINMQVNHTAVSYNQIRRIVGITTNVHNTGRELVTIQTNKPLPFQYGGV